MQETAARKWAIDWLSLVFLVLGILLAKIDSWWDVGWIALIFISGILVGVADLFDDRN